MACWIVEAAHDERGGGNYAYGKKGDQTGDEVRRRMLTGREPAGDQFSLILRYPNQEIRRKLASDAEEIADNSCFGYAQYGDPGDPYAGRYGIHYAMQEVKEFRKVTIPCNCDCSSLVGEACRHNGLAVSLYMRTANEISELSKVGFVQVPFSVGACVRGDVLWKNGHTAIVIEGDGKDEGGEKVYKAIKRSSEKTALWSTGKGPLTREAPYIILKRSEIGFTPNVIVCQQQGEILSLVQWMREQNEGFLFCSNHENNAAAGVAVGRAKGYFNPDLEEIRIPVRFPNVDYIVRVYN